MIGTAGRTVGPETTDRDLTGVFRALVESDPERGTALLGADLRVLYANPAARGHLRDGTPRATEALLPAEVWTWAQEWVSRALSSRLPVAAERWYPSDDERRLRLSLECAPNGAQVVLRTSAAVPWADPSAQRLQSRFPLTLREAQVAAGVARGLTNSDVARRLGIVEKTVKNVLMAVYRKCGVRNRVELALRAYEVPLG